MEFLNFQNYSLWVNFGVLAVAAMVVWIAGTRIAGYADRIAVTTGIGHAAVGLLLLAGVTSLPEVAVSTTSAIQGNSGLAINNLLGSIAIQIAILALADMVVRRDALTVVAGSSIILLLMALNVLLLALVAVAIAAGDVMFFHAGAWSWGMLLAYAFAIWKISDSQDRRTWVVRKRFRHDERKQDGEQGDDADGGSLKKLLVKTALAGLAILVAGFLLSRTGDAIARQTGLGQSFVGVALIAVATSLPEVSSVVAAVKLGRYEMALADIFGTNLFNVALIFLVDILHAGGPALNEVGSFSLVGALLGVTLTGIYLIGVIEQRDRTVMRMGIDSFAVLLVYFGGLFMLYHLR